MSTLGEYLDLLFNGMEGYVYAPLKFSDHWEEHYFDLPKERPQLERHIQSNGNQCDVYLSPAVYAHKSPTKKAIKNLQVAWVEFDGSEMLDFTNVPIPSALVQTSFQSHVHAYWRIDATDLHTVEDLNRRLTYHLQADSSGWDATQLLRPPETMNWKRNLPVILASCESTLHNLVAFSHVPAIVHQALVVTEVSELRPALQIFLDRQLPNKIIRMIKTETPPETTRSSFLAKLASELAEEGLSHIEIVSLLFETDKRVGKYSGRSDQMIRLSQLADYALHRLVVEDSVPLYTVDEILNQTENLTWILPQWLHSSGQLILSSAPGVGKTQMGFQIAYCILESIPFLGMNLGDSTTQSILFMSLEMDKRSLKYILSHQQKNWTNGAPKHLFILDESTTLTAYENLIEERQITVLIVDSLTELFDETADNPNAEARRVMRWCRKIRRRYSLAIILIHHNRKATEGNKKPKGLADLAGSFQFAKDSDTVIQLWEDHRGMELSTPKVRFGQKQEFLIERNEHLWFRRKDAGNGPEPVQSDTPGDKPKPPDSSGHGNNVDRSIPEKETARFSFNNKF